MNQLIEYSLSHKDLNKIARLIWRRGIRKRKRMVVILAVILAILIILIITQGSFYLLLNNTSSYICFAFIAWLFILQFLSYFYINWNLTKGELAECKIHAEFNDEHVVLTLDGSQHEYSWNDCGSSFESKEYLFIIFNDMRVQPIPLNIIDVDIMQEVKNKILNANRNNKINSRANRKSRVPTSTGSLARSLVPLLIFLRPLIFKPMINDAYNMMSSQIVKSFSINVTKMILVKNRLKEEIKVTGNGKMRIIIILDSRGKQRKLLATPVPNIKGISSSMILLDLTNLEDGIGFAYDIKNNASDLIINTKYPSELKGKYMIPDINFTDMNQDIAGTYKAGNAITMINLQHQGKIQILVSKPSR